jgi:hydroxymethylpyrimidine/phosphomethylpyrimidine kinase
LLPMAALLTPNLPEAEVLVDFPVRVEADMKRAAERLVALGAKAVLMKGGHLAGDRVVDLLFHDGRIDRFEDARILSRNTHGTGCTLASATAAGLAQKMSLRDAVARARAYVRDAIATAPGYGQGHGPLNHAVTLKA